MLSHQLASLFRPAQCVARCASRRLPATRALSSTSRVFTDNQPSEVAAAEEENDAGFNIDLDAGTGDVTSGPTTYQEFLDQVAWRYRNAEPVNWLSSTPFPMNPSFRPPPPIADAQREAMYREFMADPEKNNIRVLSQRYNLSLKRVDAILRLKGLERSFRKGKELQTGFRAGMELLLGATTHKAVNMRYDDARYDVQEADVLEQDENRDASRQRYQRLYWESVPDNGSEPIVPGSVEHARAKALQYAKRADEFKAIPELMPRVPDTEFMKRPKSKVVRLEREGRPSLEFVDVGAKFMDVNDRIRRIAAAGRRSKRRRAITEAKRQSWRSGASSS